MARALFPFHCFASPAAAAIIGADLPSVAVIALRAVSRHGQGFAIAHQQMEWDGHVLAFSCRVGKSGDIVVEFDIGTPGLTSRVIREADLRREAERLVEDRKQAAARRKSRW